MTFMMTTTTTTTMMMMCSDLMCTFGGWKDRKTMEERICGKDEL